LDQSNQAIDSCSEEVHGLRLREALPTFFSEKQIQKSLILILELLHTIPLDANTTENTQI
jgi:hypothetical protein